MTDPANRMLTTENSGTKCVRDVGRRNHADEAPAVDHEYLSLTAARETVEQRGYRLPRRCFGDLVQPAADIAHTGRSPLLWSDLGQSGQRDQAVERAFKRLQGIGHQALRGQVGTHELIDHDPTR